MPTDTEKDVLRRFKRQAKAFIKWTCDSDEQTAGTHKEDCRAIDKAKAFPEVSAILSKHDYDGMFMSLVREGYF